MRQSNFDTSVARQVTQNDGERATAAVVEFKMFTREGEDNLGFS
jgi:hypothetical protein